MELQIYEYTPERAARIALTKRNRDFVEGADTVKRERSTYLPMLPNMTASEYNGHLLRTHFYAAAARMLEILVGMVQRKQHSLTASEDLMAWAENITLLEESLEEVGEQLLSETHISNDTLLLVDYPSVTDDKSLADVEAEAIHPYLAVYQSESILEFTKQRVGNRVKPVHVRVFDDAETIRQLKLEDGKYVIYIHRFDDKGEWYLDTSATEYPKRGSEHLDFIPIEHINIRGTKGAILDKLCEANHTHYVTCGDIAYANYWANCPVHWIAGVDDEDEGGDGDKKEPFAIAAGTLWQFSDPQAKADVVEPSGTSILGHERNRDRIASDMSLMGINLLGNEKASVEAAETHTLRRSSGNSALASVVRAVSRPIERALNLVEWWAGRNENRDEVIYSLNTDFTPQPMDSAILAEINKMVATADMSKELRHTLMQRGEIFTDSDNFDEEQERIATQVIDEPQADDLDQPVTDDDSE